MSPATPAAGPFGADVALALEEERALGRGSSQRSANESSAWSWALPGQGEPCGRPEHRPFRWRLCPANHAVPFIDSCDRRDCPTCFREGWLRREAGALAAKLAAESEARRSLGRHHRVVHVSLNPRPSEWGRYDSLRSFRKERQRAYHLAKRAGLEGGAVVFHRVRCADKDDPVETDGPHFHVLGFGWIRPDARARTGWVVRNHGLRGDRASVTGTATYVLSHSHRAEARTEGILPEGKSEGLTLTVTWFGRTVRADEIVSEGPFCPLCGVCYPSHLWLDLEWLGLDRPPDRAVEVDWSKWRAYTLDRTGEWSGWRVEVVR